jgi:hypothetical protein
LLAAVKGLDLTIGNGDMVECLGIKNTCEIESMTIDLFESGMVISQHFKYKAD